MNSRPCNNCIDLICKVGIKTVYYSSDDASMVKEQVNNMKQDHTSFGFKYINHLLYPSRYKDPKLERHEEQAELALAKQRTERMKLIRKNGGKMP
jgi:deoxycytidylate deaminase